MIRREPMYFHDGADALFGWYHSAPAEPPQDCVAVICNPIGHEYTHSHRSMRHLADRLARQGIPALRFDYHGTGDSPGSDLDPDRWRCWQRNIHAAVRAARELSGRKRICLIGVRLGATLAALVAGEIEVDLLVLWNPCIRGPAYVRELQAIAALSKQGAAADQEGLEAAGFVMSAETLTALRNVNLLQRSFQVRHALLVDRDDLAADHSLSKHLAAAGIDHHQVSVPGYAAMMAEHQFSVVPDMAFNTMVSWIGANSEPGAATAAQIAHSSVSVTSHAGVEERLCRFGDAGHLFGILSRPVHAPNAPAVVLFNAGSVHHVGPHRLSVMLARELAAAGFACLRFDLEGLGDSVLRGGGRENHPYQPTASADAGAALDHLQRQFGYTRFIAIGLCSGAHTAFHAGLDLEQYDITDLVLINPLTYYWTEGMSLQTSEQYRDALSYRKSMRQLGRWMKLVRGQVNLRNLFRVAASQSRQLLNSRAQAFCEALLPRFAPRLSRDLKKLLARNCEVSLLIAEGDPGVELLLAGARWTAAKALKSGKIRLLRFEGADHTFTRSASRTEMIGAVRTLLLQSAENRGRASGAERPRRAWRLRQRLVS
jgi:alpha-beta hydrolase superfamily lysophospholipase